MASKSKVDSFGTFLETMQRRESSRQASGGSPIALLTILAESGPQPVPELLARSEMGFTDFSQALNTMREAGLLTLVGQPGQEVVELTETGQQVVKPA